MLRDNQPRIMQRCHNAGLGRNASARHSWGGSSGVLKTLCLSVHHPGLVDGFLTGMDSRAGSDFKTPLISMEKSKTQRDTGTLLRLTGMHRTRARDTNADRHRQTSAHKLTTNYEPDHHYMFYNGSI